VPAFLNRMRDTIAARLHEIRSGDGRLSAGAGGR
jgi:hypothetical protein